MNLHEKILECMDAQAELKLEPQLAKTVRDLRDKKNFDLTDEISIWDFIDALVRAAVEKVESGEIVLKRNPQMLI